MVICLFFAYDIIMKKKLILASSSPRRKEILKQMGLEFEIIPSAYDESLDNFKFSYKKIENLAYNKAKAVLEEIQSLSYIAKDALIISADTVVVLENQILLKPESREDAIKMLKSLSGKKHFVVTSICIIDAETRKNKLSSSTSSVEFKDLDDSLILDYIEQYKPFDKAGSYGIQELPDGFIASVDGSFENIVGLCSKALDKILKEMDLF